MLNKPTLYTPYTFWCSIRYNEHCVLPLCYSLKLQDVYPIITNNILLTDNNLMIFSKNKVIKKDNNNLMNFSKSKVINKKRNN